MTVYFIGYNILNMGSIKIDSKAIKTKLEAESSDRSKVSLYLSKETYGKFKKACGKLPASRVMEELMDLYIESSKEGK